MTTAAALARSLTEAFLEVAVAGAERAAATVEIAEPEAGPVIEPGDLVLGIGLRDEADAMTVLARCETAAGLVLRANLCTPPVRARAAELDLTLLTLADRTSWSALAQVLRSALERETPDDAGYSALFALAERIAELLQAPVTVEDERSRVLAWSSSRADLDVARAATIIGRRVPRAVREHYRAQGVFRHLAASDSPMLVPGSADGTKPRWVLPIRAGGEWLGSVWAALEEEHEPPRATEVTLLADVLAVHLLRLRARTDLHRLVASDQVRAALQHPPAAAPGWFPPGPWTPVVLGGPTSHTGVAPDVEVRAQVWSGILRRHGWAAPLVTDLDDNVLALVGAGGQRSAGTLAWLGDVVRTEARRAGTLWATAGPTAPAVADLPAGVRLAFEQARLPRPRPGKAFTTPDDCWARLLIRKALATSGDDLGSPVRRLAELPDEGLLTTLTAVLRHWGDLTAAARDLGVHPNTVRNRMARIDALLPLDLDDPPVRLATWLECERLATPPPST